MVYDANNVFAKILRGELPCDKIYEDDDVLAFNDIKPQAPVHVLVIPKAPYISMADLTADAPDDVITVLFRGVGHVAREMGLEKSGYRILVNSGHDSHQEVPHVHVHILAGRMLGPMLVKGWKPYGGN